METPDDAWLLVRVIALEIAFAQKFCKIFTQADCVLREPIAFIELPVA